MVSVQCFIDIFLSVPLWPRGWLYLWHGWVPCIFLGVKDGRCVGLTTLSPHVLITLKSGNLNLLEPSGPIQVSTATAYVFITRSMWISFGALPCRKKKTWWQLASRCCWNRARRLICFLSAYVTRKDLQFGTWAHPSFRRHYRFHPTTSGSNSGYGLISTPSYEYAEIKAV